MEAVGRELMAKTCAFTNQFGLTQYDGRCSFFGDGAPTALPEGLGWFIICGMGACFVILTLLLVWIDTRYSENYNAAENFSSAGRSVKMGLTACVVVSNWTWAATLLQSSNVAYKFGVSGPFWYAAGATIQVLLFSILAVEIKRKTPFVHTFPEIIRYRWGKTAHIVYMTFGFITNIIVTSMLILGGAAVMEALTGVDVYAAAFLIPIGVIFYTAQGGLRAALISSWSNTAIIYIALCIYMFLIYASHEDLGSTSKVYDNLRIIEKKFPVENNKGGSYLTMFSEPGLIFGIINIIGNFGTVFVDQSYWQGAIAARPSATYKGYLMGGLCWFAIPFTMATSLGLAGRALDLPITIAESNSGLVPPAVAYHLMGKGGAFLLVLQLFVAVISTAAAEQMSVANLVAYDIYKTYFKPNATGKQIITVSRIMVCVYGVLSGVLAVVLLKLELSLGWVYLFMGIIIGSAVFPIACALTWAKCSAFAAITSTLIGTPAAIITWLVTASTLNDGKLTIDTTGQDYPMLAGNLVALFFSALVCIILSYIKPQNFDWNDFKKIPTISLPAEQDQDSPEVMAKVLSWTYKTGGLLTFILIIFWPLLALPAGVFSKGYFTMWVIISIIWGLVAATACILLPLWECRDTFAAVFKNLILCQPLPTKTPVVGVDADESAHGEEKEYKTTQVVPAPVQMTAVPSTQPEA